MEQYTWSHLEALWRNRSLEGSIDGFLAPKRNLSGNRWIIPLIYQDSRTNSTVSANKRIRKGITEVIQDKMEHVVDLLELPFQPGNPQMHPRQKTSTEWVWFSCNSCFITCFLGSITFIAYSCSTEKWTRMVLIWAGSCEVGLFCLLLVFDR
jgi:hypothetical protein